MKKILREKFLNVWFQNKHANKQHQQKAVRLCSIKGKIDQLDLIQTKSFCFEKGFMERMKRQVGEWGKIFVNHTPHKVLLLRKYCGRNSRNCTVKEQAVQLKPGQKT